MSPEHHYTASVRWTASDASTTADYGGYRRDHLIRFPGKPELAGSSDPAFRGDPSRYNPEELLVAALSACHMLWYLHFCAIRGILVTEYEDQAEGTMEEAGAAGGRFTEVVLRPRVRIARGDPKAAIELHEAAHLRCFIANSVNFPVRQEPTVQVTEPTRAPDRSTGP